MLMRASGVFISWETLEMNPDFMRAKRASREAIVNVAKTAIPKAASARSEISRLRRNWPRAMSSTVVPRYPAAISQSGSLGASEVRDSARPDQPGELRIWRPLSNTANTGLVSGPAGREAPVTAFRRAFATNERLNVTPAKRLASCRPNWRTIQAISSAAVGSVAGGEYG